MSTAPAARARTGPVVPVVSIGDLLRDHADLLRRIRLAYGAEQADFDKEVRPTIERFAGYVHLLPATAASYFCAFGGLLHMSLEVAFYAVQAVDSTLFQGLKTISQRQHLEPRWRLATFIAGLCSEVHRAMTQTLVVDGLGAQWHPYLGGLHQWATAQRATQYQVRWVENGQESRAAALFAIPHIVDGPTLQFLANGNSLVVPHMLASVTGTPVYRDHSNVLDNLVRRAVGLVIECETSARLDFAGHQEPRAYLERYIVDAIRRLISEGNWVVNSPSSPAWYASDGAFLIWPRAGDELLKALEREHLNGLPRNSAALLELLVALRLVRQSGTYGGALNQIKIPTAGAPVSAVHLLSDTIFRSALSSDFPPVPGNLALSSAAPVPSDAGQSQAAPRSNVVQQKVLVESSPNVSTRESAPTALSLPSRSDPPDAFIANEPQSNAQLSLRNVPRLNATVRSALSEILATVGIAGVCSEALVLVDGLFVPLEAFARRNIDTALAVESMHSAGMVVLQSPADAKTIRGGFEGKETVGVLIKPTQFDGWSTTPVGPSQQAALLS